MVKQFISRLRDEFSNELVLKRSHLRTVLAVSHERYNHIIGAGELRYAAPLPCGGSLSPRTTARLVFSNPHIENGRTAPLATASSLSTS